MPLLVGGIFYGIKGYSVRVKGQKLRQGSGLTTLHPGPRGKHLNKARQKFIRANTFATDIPGHRNGKRSKFPPKKTVSGVKIVDFRHPYGGVRVNLANPRRNINPELATVPRYGTPSHKNYLHVKGMKVYGGTGKVPTTHWSIPKAASAISDKWRVEESRKRTLLQTPSVRERPTGAVMPHGKAIISAAANKRLLQQGGNVNPRKRRK